MTLIAITFFRLFSVFGLTYILNLVRKELFHSIVNIDQSFTLNQAAPTCGEI